MPDESQEQLIGLVTRGLASIQDQLRERDGRYNTMSESMVGLKFQVESMSKTLTKLESDIVRNSTDRLTMRVESLEKFADSIHTKQGENAKWIKGLLASVIMLLLGFLFNFIRISLKA
jgi:chromosome segregation ATPase